MNNINKTIAALFMAATFLPMSAQTTAKKECCKEKTECGKTLCCKTGCEKMKQRMDKTASDDVNFATRQYTLMLDQVGRKGKVNNPRTIDKLGRLVCVPIDDWCSGFFAGDLWEMYKLTNDKQWAVQAKRFTENLDSIQYLTWHHDVGFMIGSSYLNGYRINPSKAYKKVIVQTAKSLSTRFRKGAGVIQSWNVDRGWQSQRGWTCPVIIDNMMNLEHLYNAGLLFGDDTLKSVAVTHANTTLCNHFRPDFTSYHLVDYDPADGRVRRKETVQGFSDESAWARGQAWALYGYTMMFRLSGYECYLNQAENIAGMLLERLPDDGTEFKWS